MSGIAFKIALRELTGSFKQFWIFLACIILGTATISGSNSMTQVFVNGLENEARVLLGGDIAFSLEQRRISEDQRALITQFGEIAETAELDIMGTSPAIRHQVSLRAVDENFPLYGTVSMSADLGPLQSALAFKDGHWGVVVSQSFLDTFEVKIGDPVTLGTVQTIIRARVDKMPDRLATSGTLGPFALVHIQALLNKQMLQEGQRFESTLHLRTESQPADVSAINSVYETHKFEASGIELKQPKDAISGFRQILNTLNDFLVIVGVVALIAGGLGIAQATIAFLETRLGSIATLKALGAESRLIRDIYVIQIGFLAFLGSITGAALGALLPYVLIALTGNSILVPHALAIYPSALLTAGMMGMMTATIFAFPAIGRARATQAAALFRHHSGDVIIATPKLEKFTAFATILALVALTALTSSSVRLSVSLLVGTIVVWGIFSFIGIIVQHTAKSVAKRARHILRLALSNLGGPKSLARTIVPTMGLGVTILTLILSIQSNLLRQVTQTIPSSVPSLIFSQIPNTIIDEFDLAMADQNIDISDTDVYHRVPFLLSRISSLGGVAIKEAKIESSAAWLKTNEVNITFLGPQPKGLDLIAGAWWEAQYTGEQLISVKSDMVKALNLSLGDTVEFKVFGRTIAARMSAIHTARSKNFTILSTASFILSPGTLEAANPYHVAIARAPVEAVEAIIKSVETVSPDILVYQPQSSLELAARMFDNISTVIKALSSLVIAASLLVLLGAIMMMAKSRQTVTALLRIFGAQRSEVLRLYAIEFSVAGGIGALIGTVFGLLGAYPVVIYVFNSDWVFPWRNTAMALLFVVLVSVIAGLWVALSSLAHKPAHLLNGSQ